MSISIFILAMMSLSVTVTLITAFFGAHSLWIPAGLFGLMLAYFIYLVMQEAKTLPDYRDE